MERGSSALIQPCEVQARAKRFSPRRAARGVPDVHGGRARGRAEPLQTLDLASLLPRHWW